MANTIKKGSKVILKAFTGMKLGVKEVTAVDKTTITVATDKGELVFDKKTLKQIDPEPKAPRFANSIMEDDGSYVPPQRKKKAKPAPKKAAKKAKPEPEPEDEEEDELEEEEAPKKTKKTPAKSKAKKKPDPEPEEEEDDDEDDDGEDDDDFEDDDDDFEEVE